MAAGPFRGLEYSSILGHADENKPEREQLQKYFLSGRTTSSTA